jgi:succinate dehydrogenase/fumarate reductase flavoprotein subunit
MVLAERMLPGQFVVNGAGRRFVNEAAPYPDFCAAMLEGQRGGTPHVPAWMILDERTWRSWMVAGHLPIPKIPAPVPTGRRMPKDWIESGFVKQGDSWAELAEAIGVPAEALAETAARFNRFAAAGRDEDYHRGESVHDNYYGDPRLPNPNLAVVEAPPYYAFRLYPGDLGTKGGLVTDEDARVLDGDGAVIPGLYATGNTSSAVMGRSYAGPGATIGPSMTFGYVAANHVADGLRSHKRDRTAEQA